MELMLAGSRHVFREVHCTLSLRTRETRPRRLWEVEESTYVNVAEKHSWNIFEKDGGCRVPTTLRSHHTVNRNFVCVCVCVISWLNTSSINRNQLI